MIPYKKIFVIAGIIGFTIVGIAATRPEEPKPEFKNLKVLSKDISEDEMEKVMTSFNGQLGVGCNYCHERSKSPTDMNFYADGKKEKEITRDMIKMTLAINKKFFNKKIDRRISGRPVIWCRTCHRGYPRPTQ